jgi:hypothetical protein
MALAAPAQVMAKAQVWAMVMARRVMMATVMVKLTAK